MPADRRNICGNRRTVLPHSVGWQFRTGVCLLFGSALFSANLAAFPPGSQAVSPTARAGEQEPEKLPRSDLERMQGVWRVVVSLVGDELAEPDEMARRRVRITGDKLVYEYGNERQEKREGTIKLDPATQAFDWTVPLGNVTALATYKLKDDTLTIGFGNDGLIRPKHWKMGILDVCWLLVLQRERTSQGSTAEKPVWVADASKADIPDRPAGGRLHGKVFSVDKARITPWKESSGNVGDPPEKQEHADGAMLTLQAGEDRQPRNYITRFLAGKAGECVEGKTFVVSAGGLFKQTEKILDKD